MGGTTRERPPGEGWDGREPEIRWIRPQHEGEEAAADASLPTPRKDSSDSAERTTGRSERSCNDPRRLEKHRRGQSNTAAMRIAVEACTTRSDRSETLQSWSSPQQSQTQCKIYDEIARVEEPTTAQRKSSERCGRLQHEECGDADANNWNHGCDHNHGQ